MATRASALLLLFSLLVGCSTKPTQLQLAIESSPAIATVQKAPTEHQKKQVVWGGSIIKLETLADDTSRIWVLARTLNRHGYPSRGDKTSGRFIATVDSFLDPEIYRRGRRLTISGTVTELFDEPIGDKTYQYPVVAAKDYKLWPVQRIARSRLWREDPFWPLFDSPAARHHCLHFHLSRRPHLYHDPLSRRQLRRYCATRWPNH